MCSPGSVEWQARHCRKSCAPRFASPAACEGTAIARARAAASERTTMMNGGMGWMMDMGGGLVALITIVLLVGGIVLLARFLGRDASGTNLMLIVLASVGVLALLGAGGMVLMHGGMMA